MSPRGEHAEDLAAAYLQQRGLKLVERNYRC
jgi:Holliday junction resolvase-like predicted endonuclease